MTAPSDSVPQPTGATTRVYTDGACSGNPGPGGWAWATVDGREASGGEADTTNQRMELTAVLEALRAIDGEVEVYSDSTYVVHCFNERWYEGWLARNWRNSQRKPVANRDLWEPLVGIFQDRRDQLTFVWVKGHSGDRMNDYVDQLAVAEIEQYRSAGGTDGSPGEITPPWPIERAVVVFGTDDLTPELQEKLAAVIAGLDPGRDVVISGLRRGAELTAAEFSLEHHLPLGVVLPFDDPARRWPSPTKRRFEACVQQAEWVVCLDGDERRPGRAVAERNRWLRSSAVGAIVVGDPGLSGELDATGLGVVDIVEDD